MAWASRKPKRRSRVTQRSGADGKVKGTMSAKARANAKGSLGRARLVFVGAVVVSAVVVFAWFPAGSLLSQRSNLHGTESELNALHAQDGALAQENKNLSDSGEIGRIAREQYQLVSPGQRAYEVLPPSGAAAAGTTYAGDPGSDGPVTPSATPELPPGGVTTTTTTEPGQAPAAHAPRRRFTLDPDIDLIGRFRLAHGARSQILALSPPGFARTMATVSDTDRVAVALSLGREPEGAFTVVVRAEGGGPVVIANEPFLRDGTPMPTRYWLVDPALRAAVGRLEAVGGVREAEAQVDGAALADAHRRYAAGRDGLIPPDWNGPRPSGGVGGTRQGVKCLHAHVAWWLAGGNDPVGTWVAQRLELSRTAPEGSAPGV